MFVFTADCAAPKIALSNACCELPPVNAAFAALPTPETRAFATVWFAPAEMICFAKSVDPVDTIELIAVFCKAVDKSLPCAN